jgi:hypothetical protein
MFCPSSSRKVGIDLRPEQRMCGQEQVSRAALVPECRQIHCSGSAQAESVSDSPTPEGEDIGKRYGTFLSHTRCCIHLYVRVYQNSEAPTRAIVPTSAARRDQAG